MAIEVRVPTILRSYTGGAKVVEGTGDTIGALIDNLDASHHGLKGRLITDDGGLHRFVNVYVNDEDIRFLGSLDAKLSDGDSAGSSPPASTPTTPRRWSRARCSWRSSRCSSRGRWCCSTG